MLARLRVLILLLFISNYLPAQDSLSNGSVSLKFVESLSRKTSAIAGKLDKQSSSALAKMRREEEAIARKLIKSDSAKGTELLASTRIKYEQFESSLSQLSHATYSTSLDSISSSLKFLRQNPRLLKASRNSIEKLNTAIANTDELENSFKQAEAIKQFLKERKQLLTEKLNGLGFAKNLKRLNKQAYYFSAQLNEYKGLLNDRKKLERKALEALSKSKLFKDFMRRNSTLASLFRMPGNANDPSSFANLAGLQTRTQVNNIIQQQIVIAGPAAQQQFRQNIQDAQSQLNGLKDKVSRMGGSGSDLEMPEGFKPNNQKTKSFWKRIEYGTNVQSQKGNNFLPVTSDLGLSVGYKINDRSIIGIGASYKLGWGSNIRHIRLSHEGVGLRSFVDWKIRGSFWLTGGYEQNYTATFRNVDQLRNISVWQQSGLIGVSKMVSLKTKFFKKTKVQVLWDFLSSNNAISHPIVFRIGYSF